MSSRDIYSEIVEGFEHLKQEREMKEWIKSLGISSYDMLKAKIWDNKETTRKHKQKLPRKTRFTRAEKVKYWYKHYLRYGQFKKRGM